MLNVYLPARSNEQPDLHEPPIYPMVERRLEHLIDELVSEEVWNENWLPS